MEAASEREIESHESWGLIGIVRSSGNPGPLFGSSIDHQNFMTLRIRRAERDRRLGAHSYYGREQLVEVMLSPTQFADMVTCVGMGDGVPCTIHRVGRERMERCPPYDQRRKFEAEFEASARKATGKMDALIADVAATFAKPNVTQADRVKVMAILRQVRNEQADTQPFIQSMFNEAMDKTVTEAKGEVEAFVQHKVASLGLDALREQVGARALGGASAPTFPMLPGEVVE